MDNSIILESSLSNLRLALSTLTMESFVLNTIQALMNLEREEYLKDAKDKGNGYYSRAFKSFIKNGLTINVPRTRSGQFNSVTLEMINVHQNQVNDFCLALYKKGMTSRDISDLMSSFFGNSLSHTTINNLSKSFHEIRTSWENSKLESKYIVIFCDCIFITVRRDNSYSDEAVYVCYGVREDYKRELIALDINPTEGAYYWGEVFDHIKSRGVQEIGLVVADGLTGLEDIVSQKFKTQFQKCVVHKMRNILNHVRPKEKGEVAFDLKNIFDNFDETVELKDCLKKVEEFTNKWKTKYPKIGSYFKEGNIEYYFTYIKFPKDVRRLIYTTNSIENLNRIIRKGTKNKLSFESPDSLLDYVFMIIKEFEEDKWMKYPVHDYKNFYQTQSY